MKDVLKGLSFSQKTGLTLGPTGLLALALWGGNKVFDDYMSIRDAVGSCVTAEELKEVHTRIDAEHEIGVIHDTILTHMVIGASQ